MHIPKVRWGGRTWVLAARTPEYAALERMGLEEVRSAALPKRREAAILKVLRKVHD